jgi:hypothetical protein
VFIHDAFAAGFFAANILSLAAAVILFLYLRSGHDEATSLIAVLLLCASPFSVFLDAPFTESLFLCLVAGMFLAIEKRLWLAVGICFALLSVTRPNGILIAIVPLAFLANDIIQGRCLSWRKASKILWLGPALLPYIAWIWYNNAKTGDPLFYYNIQQRWYSGDSLIGNFFLNLGSLFRFSELQWHAFHSSRIDVIVMTLSIIILMVGMRRLRITETAYAAVILFIPLIAKDLMSYSRYAITAWPLFLLIALWLSNRKWLVIMILALSIIAQLFLTIRLTNWDWVG